MTPEAVITIGQQALTVTALLAAPLLLAALVVGLLVGMIQEWSMAATAPEASRTVAVTASGPGPVTWMVEAAA